MTERKLDHSKPPLPFMGSQMRWWRELGRLALSLPYGACVFDAFGGAMAAAMVIKDARPDLTVVTNDYETASDSQTAWSWLNKRSSIRNKMPTTACVDNSPPNRGSSHPLAREDTHPPTPLPSTGQKSISLHQYSPLR